MTKHTTGVIYAEGTTVYIDKMGTGRRIAECYAENLNEDYYQGLREAEANARLFAAAAGLYDALKDAHDRLEIIAFLGMDVPAAMCGGDHSRFYKSRAYDCIATAANGLNIVSAAIAKVNGME